LTIGDTLFGIAQQFYGHGSLFGFIAKVNGITDSSAISTGQVFTSRASEVKPVSKGLRCNQSSDR
jgi:nucleoid-associated protein YgaU